MSHWEWITAVLVGVLSVARTARLLIYDDFPPVAWVRARWFALFDEDDPSPWRKLAECQYCVSPYLAAGMLLWAWSVNLNEAWWIINGVWAASYVAAIVVSYDQPEE
jgi:hypothetical protein